MFSKKNKQSGFDFDLDYDDDEEEIETYSINDYDDDYDEDDNEDECVSGNSNNSTKKNKKHHKKNKLRFNFKIFIGVILYIIFVVFGAVSTTYDSYNKPQVINVALRAERKEFEKVNNDYENIYKIIQEIDNLDSDIEKSSVEDSFAFATKYKNLINVINVCNNQVKGVTYADEYSFMQSIAEAICKNMGEYVTLMSNGMSAQNSGYFQEAAEYKQNYLTQFKKYSDNLKQFKKAVKLKK